MTGVLELTGPWIAFTVGAVTGSFANVCIHRLPRRESIISPSSRCTHCGSPLRWHDNIPIVSYIILRGRCRDCAGSISPRYLVIELLTAALFLGLWYLTRGALHQFVLNAVFGTALIICMAIDLEHRLLPDRVTVPLLGFGLLISLLPGDPSPLGSLIGTLLGGGIMYGIAVVGDAVYKRETMGGGDIKLAAAIGAFMGWPILLVALFAAFLFGAAGGLVYLGLGGRDKTIPFGPFLAAGALVALAVGNDLWLWYSEFFH